MKRRLYIAGKEYMALMRKYHISAYASSIAFFTYLSLIPMMLVFFAVLPYTPLTEAKLMEIATEVLPQYLVPAAVSVISNMYDSSGAVLSVTLLVLIWSGGKGMLALLRGLNVINRVEEKRNYVRLRLRASIYTVILLVMVIVLLVLVVFGEWIAAFLTGIFPHIHYLFDALFAFRPLFMILLLTLFFGAVFTWIPNNKKQFLYELPGALFASCLWYFASWVFSVYVNHFFAYNLYGSVATATVIMLWLYICFYIVLAGALFNCFLMPAFEYLHERLQMRKRDKKKDAV